MGAPFFDLLCNSMILISPINWKVEIMVIYLALVRSAHYSLSPLPANVSYEEPNCSLKLKIFIMLLLYIFKE